MDVESLLLTEIPPAKSPPRIQYLSGPIPLPWISRAACLPGRGLNTAMALWHIYKLSRCRTVKMQAKILLVFGLTRKSYTQGLARLELAGLISVERKHGATPTVTLLGIGRQ
jgi:hypothetical protein